MYNQDMARWQHQLKIKCNKYFTLYDEKLWTPSHFIYIYLKIKRNTLNQYLYKPRTDIEKEKGEMYWEAIDRILAHLETRVVNTQMSSGLMFVLKAWKKELYIPELKYKQELEEKEIQSRDTIQINYSNNGNNIIKGLFKNDK